MIYFYMFIIDKQYIKDNNDYNNKKFGLKKEMSSEEFQLPKAQKLKLESLILQQGQQSMIKIIQR